MKESSASTFPIPSSLQDLECAPYNLLPYPPDFDDDDEAARANSFDRLVKLLVDGNKVVRSTGVVLFLEEEEYGVWMDGERVQALYTLVRKSSSLSTRTRAKLISALCQSINALCTIMSTTDENQVDLAMSQTTGNQVLPQSFRDAFACHLYMLYSVMFFRENETKHSSKDVIGKSTKNKRAASQKKNDEAIAAASREECAKSMLAASQAMASNKSKLWRRGVPDEDVVSIPLRIAYQMLENGSGVIARKAASVDDALIMIAATVDSVHSLLNTVVAALLDMMHSFEHMATIVADLCTVMKDDSLPKEILREIGRLDTHAHKDNETSGKASGIKNVAPFITELAERRPQFVLSNISLVLPHLDSEPYYLRSAIIAAIIPIVSRCKERDEEEETEEDENETHRENCIGKSKNALLDILTERAHDKSSFTRVSVLKAWSTLTENDSLPLERVIGTTALAIDRLRDAKVNVRRSAMQLLTLLLEHNPYSPCLDPDPIKDKIKELQSYLKTNMSSALRSALDEALDENSERSQEEIENAAMKAAIAECLSNANNLAEEEKEYHSKVLALQFATSALDFINLFSNSTATFESMLLSSNGSDVTTALRFFIQARHFRLPCAVTGMKKALALMWSSEKKIRDEVKQAFVEVFIAPGGEILPSKNIAHNLIVLAGEATVSELASIEEAIGVLVHNEEIPEEVFRVLWSVASKAPGEARSAAMLVLSMGAKADPHIVDSASRLRYLLESGLGDYAEEHHDWKTARSAACALQQISTDKPPPGSAKSIVLEFIMERLMIIIRGDWCRDDVKSDTTSWFSAAEQGINALFVVCPQPELLCSEVIKGMEAMAFGMDMGRREKCSARRLSRFFFVLGHIALKLLVYTESISSSVRRAMAAKTIAKQESVDKRKTLKKRQQSGSNEDSDDDDAIEAELGVAAEAEAEADRMVTEISEKEIVGRGLIGVFSPLLLRVVANEEGNFSSPILMQSATLCLCKFMCISRSYCEKHLPLLFTAISATKDTTLRANTAVALGDLAFRFPNEVEPYTPHVYACLRDESTKVRRHTLMVLTHLILNDMVKVKGQVCEIALCLEDQEPRIRDMARLLFSELAKRSNNPIYNLLPDIISRMSTMEIPKKVFRNILSFLLKFIENERQNEMLVEKLCHRFPTCASISQKADISFCLSQLKINAKCIKIFNDLFKCYKDALFDKDVFDSFANIITKTKKVLKTPEAKESMEEWEEKITSENKFGMENHIAGNKAERAKLRAAKRAKKKTVKKAKKKVDYEGETDEEDDNEISECSDEDNEIQKENVVPAPKEVVRKERTAPPRRSRRQRSSQ